MINNEKDAVVIAENSADEKDVKVRKNVAEDETDKENIKTAIFSSEKKMQYDADARNLRSLVETIASLIAERSSKHFVEITKKEGLENMGRVLSLMEECERTNS